MPTALLLVDIQNDYFPGGAMELAGADDAAGRAARLLSEFRRLSLPVFHIQHISTRPNATFFRPQTKGVEIHPGVRPLAGERLITKNYPNSFRGTPLEESLRGAEVKSLVIAGMMTHMCVDTTVRAASDLGFSCSLAHDACATRDLVFGGQKVEAAAVQIAYMAALNGSFGTVLAAEDICASLGPGNVAYLRNPASP